MVASEAADVALIQNQLLKGRRLPAVSPFELGEVGDHAGHGVGGVFLQAPIQCVSDTCQILLASGETGATGGVPVGLLNGSKQTWVARAYGSRRSCHSSQWVVKPK